MTLLTEEDKRIMKSGTFIEKQNLGIDHYGDDNWLDEASKYLKTLD